MREHNENVLVGDDVCRDIDYLDFLMLTVIWTRIPIGGGVCLPIRMLQGKWIFCPVDG